MSRKKSLERIVEHHAKVKYVKHFDPLDAISHHVVFVIFLALLFMFGIFMFMTAEQTPQTATTFAIYEFEPITIHKDIANSVSDFIYNIRHSEERAFVLLALYTFWIIIFGLVNTVLFEREKYRK